MKETSKASQRRLDDDSIDWYSIFKGVVLDVGSGDDPLSQNDWPDAAVIPFDTPQGDANKIDEYYKEDFFDCVHGSQVMEHMRAAGDFFTRCLKITKPGGWVIMTIPDYDLYEHQAFPSKYNGDHKSTWSLWRRTRDGKGYHVHVPTFVKRLRELGHAANCRLITTNYDYMDQDVDQTFNYDDGVECFIEIVCQKKPNPAA